jgi:hypothetical protein
MTSSFNRSLWAFDPVGPNLLFNRTRRWRGSTFLTCVRGGVGPVNWFRWASRHCDVHFHPSAYTTTIQFAGWRMLAFRV